MSNRNDTWKNFQSWLSSPLGEMLLEVESLRLEKRLENVFGYHFLLLGEPQFLKTISSTSIQHRVWVHPHALSIVEEKNRETKDKPTFKITSQEIQQMGSPLACRQDKLAILSDEVDVVMLAHCLENIQNPHEVVREAYRILKSEGNILISGFNPWSLWGFWRGLMHYIKPVPWGRKFISVSRLKDWLALLGFDVVHVEKYFFRFPFSNPVILFKLKRE
jgi:SAM-dependent methyltransferase